MKEAEYLKTKKPYNGQEEIKVEQDYFMKQTSMKEAEESTEIFLNKNYSGLIDEVHESTYKDIILTPENCSQMRIIGEFIKILS